MVRLRVDDWAASVRKSIACNDLLSLKKYLQNKARHTRKTIVEHQVYGSTALIRACEIGNLEIVKYLVENCDANVNIQLHLSDKFLTPTQAACSSGNVQILEYLISKGVDLERKSRDHTTFLMENVRNLAVSTCLILNGISTYVTDLNGKTAFDYAVEENAIGTVLLLIKNGVDVNSKLQSAPSAIYYACSNRRVNLLDILVQNGGNIHEIDENGNNYLMKFIDHPEICEYLLSVGIDIEATDSKSRKAVHHAVDRKAMGSLKVLGDWGMDLDAKDINNRTPLHYAVIQNDISIISLILSLGADIGAEDKDGMDAIKIAVGESGLEAVQCLQDHGSDIQSIFPDGMNLIQKAALLNKESIVLHLVKDSKSPGASRIEGYELLAAKYMIQNKQNEAASFYGEAVVLRHCYNLFTRQQTVLNNFLGDIGEPGSIDEILQSNNATDLYLQGVLIMGRILGPNCMAVIKEMYAFYSKFQYESMDFKVCLKIILHIFQAMVSKSGEIPSGIIEVCDDVMFVLTFQDSPVFDFDEIYQVVHIFIQTLGLICHKDNDLDDEVKYTLPSRNKCFQYLQTAIYTLCRLLAICTQEQVGLIQSEVKRLVYLHGILRNLGFKYMSYFNLLSILISSFDEHFLFKDSEKAVYSMMVMLIEGGDVVDTIDDEGRSALHCILDCCLNKDEYDYCFKSSDRSIMDDIIKLLLDNGTHMDTEDKYGNCLIDLLKEYGHSVCKVKDRTLQCLCSDIILKNGISFEKHVPQHLIPFVKFHTKYV